MSLLIVETLKHKGELSRCSLAQDVPPLSIWIHFTSVDILGLCATVSWHSETQGWDLAQPGPIQMESKFKGSLLRGGNWSFREKLTSGLFFPFPGRTSHPPYHLLPRLLSRSTSWQSFLSSWIPDLPFWLGNLILENTSSFTRFSWCLWRWDL
jgi:hypothetical protein